MNDNLKEVVEILTLAYVNAEKSPTFSRLMISTAINQIDQILVQQETIKKMDEGFERLFKDLKKAGL